MESWIGEEGGAKDAQAFNRNFHAHGKDDINPKSINKSLELHSAVVYFQHNLSNKILKGETPCKKRL